MIPDAIVVFSAGVMPLPDGGWRTTTTDENDAFGTLGGHDRVAAAALLAKHYPSAMVVAACKRMDNVLPTLATIYAEELVALGVSNERIFKEENSVNTGTAVAEAVKLAKERRWQHIMFVSSEYQIPRIKAFFEETGSTLDVTFVSADSVLVEHDPSLATYFKELRESPDYQKRLAAEARGIAAIKSGTYRPAPIEDKRERSA